MGNNIRLAVIGGGPGGYVAAIRAAQLGANVTLIEKNKLGGTCLNVGCIPTKALLHAAELLEETKHAGEYGINIDLKGVDWKKVQAKKEAIVAKLVGGVGALMKANNINVVTGTASFASANRLNIAKLDGSSQTDDFDKIIIATGSSPAMPPIPGLRETAACVDSSGALSLSVIPKTMLVIGGGVIGVELAGAYCAYGTQVKIVEAMPGIIPAMDAELANLLKKRMEKNGIQILTSAKVLSVQKSEKGALAKVDASGKAEWLEAEVILVAAGRKAYTESLHLDRAGIVQKGGCIQVDAQMRTNLPNVYAIGDCLGKVMLAHLASAQGEIAAEHALGRRIMFNGSTNPSCIYTRPEFAGVGLTEDDAKAKKLDYVVGRFPLTHNGKSLIMNSGEGIVKVIAGREYGEILGVHILGPRATDLIAECALAIGMEATDEDISATIHAHPTLAEAVREAVMAASKKAIHIPNQ